MRALLVAIDGPAGSGKSTTARALARTLGFLYLDTGAMYRTLALAVLRAGGDPDQKDAVMDVLAETQVDVVLDNDGNRVHLNGEDVTTLIRTPEVGEGASRVSTWPAVRQKMVAEQRRIAAEQLNQGTGVVLDGRDIGTVVFPEADLKIFLVADPGVRARRRAEELRRNGETVDFDEVLRDLLERDERDRTRSASPLRKAEDAVEVDTTNLDIEQQVDAVVRLTRRVASSMSSVHNGM